MSDNLKWLSTSDLEALQGGDLSKVSTQGLTLLKDGPGKGGSMLGNAAMGALRGVKDVIDTGAELLASGYDKVTGADKPTMSSLILSHEVPGYQPQGEGARIRAMNAEGNRQFGAEYGGSTAATLGRVGGNVLGALPVGGFAGAGVRAAATLPGIAGSAAAPVVQALGTAIGSGGMRTGLAQSGAKDLAIRTAGGALSGGLQSAAVDPGSAGTGAMIGAAIPGGAKAAGAVGDLIAGAFRGPGIAPGVAEAAQLAQGAGYVLPPTQVSPTLINRALEGTAGKITTAQNASSRNQAVTNQLARTAIGASDLTPEGLAMVRSAANEAYTNLGKASPFVVDDSFRSALERASGGSKEMAKNFPELANPEIDGLVSGLGSRPQFDAQPTIEAIKQLRFDGAANKGAMDPTKKALGSVQMKVSSALEDLIDRNLEATGQTDLLSSFRDARKTLAKTYDVEKALNASSGNVDAAKLASLEKKRPRMTGELKTIADFAAAFPKAAQTPERMGSLPQISPLDLFATSGASALSGNPLWLAGLLARPAARAATLSGPVQAGLLSGAGAAQSAGLLSTPAASSLLELAARGAPVTATSR